MGRLYTHDIQSNPFLNVSEENRFLVQLKSNQHERAMIHTFQWRNKRGPTASREHFATGDLVEGRYPIKSSILECLWSSKPNTSTLILGITSFDTARI